MTSIVFWLVVGGLALLGIIWYLAGSLVDEMLIVLIRVSPDHVADVMVAFALGLFVLAFSGVVKIFVHEPYWSVVVHNAVTAATGAALGRLLGCLIRPGKRS